MLGKSEIKTNLKVAGATCINAIPGAASWILQTDKSVKSWAKGTFPDIEKAVRGQALDSSGIIMPALLFGLVTYNLYKPLSEILGLPDDDQHRQLYSTLIASTVGITRCIFEMQTKLSEPRVPADPLDIFNFAILSLAILGIQSSIVYTYYKSMVKSTSNA